MHTRSIVSVFLQNWVSELYYVWKTCREDCFLREYFDMGQLNFPSFQERNEWEVVCEDDETQILAHPLLPHPMDFVRRIKPKSRQYADVARFECTQTSLCLLNHNVILTREPSYFPHFQKTPFLEEVVPTISNTIIQNNFQVAILSYKLGTKKRKKALSRIMKETRKKKKPTHHQYKQNTILPMERTTEIEEYNDGWTEYQYELDNYSLCSYDDDDDRYRYNEYYNCYW